METILENLKMVFLSILHRFQKVKQPMPLYCKDKLLQMNSNAPVNELEETFDMFGITTKEEQAHFLSQVIHESGHFKYKVENLNYSASGLAKTWKTRFANPDGTPNELALSIERKPKEIANAVYNGRMGNEKGTDDGWNYRGRGFIQLTGKNNYRDIGQYLFEQGFVDDENIFIDTPDIVAEDKYAVLVAVAFWKRNNIYRDPITVKDITKRINGGYNGLTQRNTLYEELIAD